MEQVAAELDVALVFSIAGKLRGRGKVERIFEATNQLFLCTPGYTPPGSTPARPVLSLPELDVRLRTLLVETLSNTGSTGRPALLLHCAGKRAASCPAYLDSAEPLDLLLLPVAHTDGVRRLIVTSCTWPDIFIAT